MKVIKPFSACDLRTGSVLLKYIFGFLSRNEFIIGLLQKFLVGFYFLQIHLGHFLLFPDFIAMPPR
jgi:hypothetical protein